MTQMQMVARVLVRVGVAMVILCLLCRLGTPKGTDLTVLSLALVASLGVVATGVITQHVSRRRDAKLDEREARRPVTRRGRARAGS